MQECSVTVRLGGSLNHTVPKPTVTPAEIQVLRAIHGGDSVVDIVPIRFNKRDHVAEFDRLTRLYGATNVGPGEGLLNETGQQNLVAKLFPGVSPRLPLRLRDIGLGAYETVTAPSRPDKRSDGPAEVGSVTVDDGSDEADEENDNGES